MGIYKMRKVLIALFLISSFLNAKDIYATFNVEAQRSANLAFSSSGVVKEVLVDVSKSVKKGEILALLENSDLKSQLEIAKANLKTAQISSKFATIELKRQEKIKDVIDESQYDKYKLSFESALANVELQKANVALAESLLDKTMLYAPFDGVISFKDVESGDVVSGQAIRTVFKIVTKKEVKLLLTFDEKYHKDVKIGQKFLYKTAEDEQNSHEGIITKIYPIINQQERKLTAEVKATDIPIGLFGTGFIKAE